MINIADNFGLIQPVNDRVGPSGHVYYECLAVLVALSTKTQSYFSSPYMQTTVSLTLLRTGLF